MNSYIDLFDQYFNLPPGMRKVILLRQKGARVDQREISGDVSIMEKFIPIGPLNKNEKVSLSTLTCLSLFSAGRNFCVRSGIFLCFAHIGTIIEHQANRVNVMDS